MIAAPEIREFDEDVRRLVDALPEPRPTNAYAQILVAYDGSKGARAALERAAAIASPNSTLTVITVIPFEAIGASPDPIKPELRDWQWKALTEATALLERRGIHAFIEAAAGNPAAVIVEVARTLKADLVVLGRGHDRRWRTSMKTRSIRRAVVQQLECDALVVAAA
jgi:nucleotide-binding universal stress UspA family protein